MLCVATTISPGLRAEPRDSSWVARPPAHMAPTPDAAVATARSARPTSHAAAEPAAAHALEIARRDITNGRSEIAGRLLEALIARYPDAPSTEEARRELYALYRSDNRIAGRRQSDRVPPDYTAVASVHSAPPEQSTLPEQDTNRWQASIFSNRALQSALREETGDRIFFSAGSADIGARSRMVVQAQARWLLRHPELIVSVEGHADDSRAGADNELLSAQRAETVRVALIAAGVEAPRIRAKGFGVRDPIAECDDNACAAQNRRVLLQVLVPYGAAPGYRQHTGLPSSAEGAFRR